MSADTVSTGPTPSDSPAGRHYIRLQAGHSLLHRAAELLTILGGRRITPVAGVVYAFETTTERDAALDRARREMGWTIEVSFDGRPWLPRQPTAY